MKEKQAQEAEIYFDTRYMAKESFGWLWVVMSTMTNGTIRGSNGQTWKFARKLSMQYKIKAAGWESRNEVLSIKINDQIYLHN